MDPSTATAVSRFNNEGVGLIESGLYDEAAAEFAKGLTMVQQVLALQGDDQADEVAANSMDTSAEPASHSPPCHFHKLQSRRPRTSVRTKKRSSAINLSFLAHQSAFPLMSPTTRRSRTISSPRPCSAITSLTHHLSALSGSNAQKRLSKSLKLYEVLHSL
jgi:hypothetical protein